MYIYILLRAEKDIMTTSYSMPSHHYHTVTSHHYHITITMHHYHITLISSLSHHYHIYHVMSYHLISSHCFTSHHITSHHITSLHITSHHITLPTLPHEWANRCVDSTEFVKHRIRLNCSLHSKWSSISGFWALLLSTNFSYNGFDK